MNERGGIINIIVAILIMTFVLIALMNPISQLTAIADDKLAVLQSTDRQARDINGSVVAMDGGSSLGNLTMTLLTGIGFFFLLGLVIYIILYGPDRQPSQYSGGLR